MNEMGQFFKFARDRYRLYLMRKAGCPPPWTDDPILASYRFCNVFREHDKTTIWFQNNIRGPLANDPKVLIATVAFRWFNRISTGRQIKHVLLEEGWNRRRVELNLRGIPPPLVTGAYMIKSPAGMNKLTGLCDCIDRIAADQIHLEANIRSRSMATLQRAWDLLRTYPFMGRFMAYEVVTDLRHTYLLNNASDVRKWASAGPGCARGLGWVTIGDPRRYRYDRVGDQKDMIILMMSLLLSSSLGEWPREWPPWEMREVEHTLCEYDKYRQAQNGKMPKRRYEPC